MENQTQTKCAAWPLPCNGGVEQPHTVTPGDKRPLATLPGSKDPQQPWSVFGEVYWI